MSYQLPGPILAIDTSANVGVALLGGARVVRLIGTESRKHAETLMPLVERALAEADVDRRDLHAIAVGTGPAPFTGLRVGLVTARTLAHALGIPVWGVSGLDVLAADAVARLGLADGRTVLTTADARRREVYAARYRVEAGRAVLCGGPEVGAADSLAAAHDLPADAVVVGPGAMLYPEVLSPIPGGPDGVDPVVLAELAAMRAADGIEQDTEPLYLRRPDVQIPGAPKRAGL